MSTVKRMPAYTPEVKARVMDRVKAGEKVSRIGKDTGIHYGTIYAWMKDAGIKPNYKRGKPRLGDDNRKELASPEAANKSALHDAKTISTEVRDVLIYLRHAETEIMKEMRNGKKLSRANLLTLLALDVINH